jgi:hypothetical protein
MPRQLTLIADDYELLQNIIGNYYGEDIERILLRVTPVSNGYRFAANYRDLIDLMELIWTEAKGFNKIDQENAADNIHKSRPTTADKLFNIYRAIELHLSQPNLSRRRYR